MDVMPSSFSIDFGNMLSVNWSADFLIGYKYFLMTIKKFTSVFGTTGQRQNLLIAGDIIIYVLGSSCQASQDFYIRLWQGMG